MIVKFAATFHVPGFGRRRFQKGVVDDVPEALRDRLPKSAVILDRVPEEIEEEEDKQSEDLKAMDYARKADELETKKLEEAGLGGFVDGAADGSRPVVDPEPEVTPEPVADANMVEPVNDKKAKFEAELAAEKAEKPSRTAKKKG